LPPPQRASSSSSQPPRLRAPTYTADGLPAPSAGFHRPATYTADGLPAPPIGLHRAPTFAADSPPAPFWEIATCKADGLPAPPTGIHRPPTYNDRLPAPPPAATSLPRCRGRSPANAHQWDSVTALQAGRSTLPCSRGREVMEAACKRRSPSHCAVVEAGRRPGELAGRGFKAKLHKDAATSHRWPQPVRKDAGTRAVARAASDTACESTSAGTGGGVTSPTPTLDDATTLPRGPSQTALSEALLARMAILRAEEHIPAAASRRWSPPPGRLHLRDATPEAKVFLEAARGSCTPEFVVVDDMVDPEPPPSPPVMAPLMGSRGGQAGGLRAAAGDRSQSPLSSAAIRVPRSQSPLSSAAICAGVEIDLELLERAGW